MSFDQLQLAAPIFRAVAEKGYTSATKIQSQAIPHIMDGRDILGCAQTGTGKTAAFAIPILQRLKPVKRPHGIRALVLTPTRELAIQIEENFADLGKYLPSTCLAIFGGVPQGRQVAALRKGVDVLIATPGRLLDLMQQGLLSLSQVEILVLDEADRMLDMGFVHDVKRVVAKVPKNRQTLFFSATMPLSIRKFANSMLRNPVELSVTPVSSTVKAIEQSVYFVEKREKTGLLVRLLSDQSIGSSLVFTRTKHGADKLVRQLSKTGIYAAAIHGNKSQQSRQRALQDFKNRKIRVLVATDIASRGIDIDELPHVVNYELPDVAETYVHRTGRTGRAGKNGIAVSFCSSDERDNLKDIQKLIGFQLAVKKEIAVGEPILCH